MRGVFIRIDNIIQQLASDTDIVNFIAITGCFSSIALLQNYEKNSSPITK